MPQRALCSYSRIFLNCWKCTMQDIFVRLHHADQSLRAMAACKKARWALMSIKLSQSSNVMLSNLKPIALNMRCLKAVGPRSWGLLRAKWVGPSSSMTVFSEGIKTSTSSPDRSSSCWKDSPRLLRQSSKLLWYDDTCKRQKDKSISGVQVAMCSAVLRAQCFCASRSRCWSNHKVDKHLGWGGLVLSRRLCKPQFWELLYCALILHCKAHLYNGRSSFPSV